jgi:hypothetical protein
VRGFIDLSPDLPGKTYAPPSAMVAALWPQMNGCTTGLVDVTFALINTR